MISASENLRETWREYRAANPNIRIRDAALALGVSEAELVSTACGENVTRLETPGSPQAWGELLGKIGALGRVMALTRNSHCVHERSGTYGECRIFGSMGNILGAEIDLRFFLQHWHHTFAVSAEGRGGRIDSLQFFDENGTAVHKIYLKPESRRDAFEAIIAERRHPRQTAISIAARPSEREPVKQDEEMDVAGFRSGWRAMQDTHEFYGLLQRFGAGRVQALRLIGSPLARPLGRLVAEPLLRQAAGQKLPVMVFVSNPGMIQIHTGPVENVVPSGLDREWINVLDPDFNLHLRQKAVEQAWAVEKPTRDGWVTSVECFDADENLIAQFFGKRKPGEPQLKEWKSLVDGLE